MDPLAILVSLQVGKERFPGASRRFCRVLTGAASVLNAVFSVSTLPSRDAVMLDSASRFVYPAQQTAAVGTWLATIRVYSLFVRCVGIL